MRFKTGLRTSTTSTFDTLDQGFPFWIESSQASDEGNPGDLHPSFLRLLGALPESVDGLMVLSPIGLPFFKDEGDNEIICDSNFVVTCYFYGNENG